MTTASTPRPPVPAPPAGGPRDPGPPAVGSPRPGRRPGDLLGRGPTEHPPTECPPTGQDPSVAAGQAPPSRDTVIEAALRDLESVDPGDLDGILAAGELAHRALQARLSDLQQQ